MRNMINGVEEHSDNFIRESTVSDLIDVWSFLRALIQTSSSSETKLLNNLHKLLAMDKNKNIEAKLKNCSQNIHGLKRLHKNLSNRTEFTKEIIAHLLEDSITAINLGSSMCTIKMRYKNGKSIYGMEELNDLRSRCLLLANTDTRNETTAHSYRNFIELVDLLQSIQKKVMELFDVGYPVNMNSEFVSYQDLEEEKKHLDNMYEEWINVKTKYRDEFHILNVYHSQQIWMIEQHLSKLSRNISLEQKEENELLNLLRLINPGIVMEKITDQFDFSFSNEDKIEQRLTRILTFLSKISEPKVATGTINKLLPNGATVCCVDKRKIIPLLLTIFIGCHDTPSPLNTLVCYEDTSWSEVEAFLFRCRQSNSQLHCLLNVHKLNFYVKDSLIELIHKFEQKESQFLMLLITERGKDFLSEEMRSNVRDFKELDATTLKNFVSKIRPNVEFVISHINGIGKTEYIKEQSFELGKLPILFPVSGSLERKKLVNRLAEINFLKCSSLHIDISIINNDPDFIDFFLFEMLVIGKVSFGSTIVLLSSIPTFIEIANTVNNSLVNSIAVREFFKVSDLSSDMDRFIASEEILSPVQIVCQYLQRYDKNQLINNDIVFGRVGDKQSLNPIPNNECIRLIKRYLLNKDHALSSFSAVHVYLNVLANQLLMMSASIYFRVGSLEKMGASSSIRNELLLALINLTTEFSSSASTLNKIHVLNDDQQAMLEIFNGFLHWEDSNHLLVLFHNINSQTISAVYRDSSHVPDSVKNLLRSQHTKSTSQTYTLPNYSTLKRDELLEVLKKICLTSPLNNSEDDKDYALTPDNILKMILIITRVRARVPVVILGETGCGKTSLIKYLANVIGAVIITKDIHAGVTEEDIVSVVLEANTKAILENVNVWLFLDEINTCDSVGLISEVICNKTCNGKPLNRNLSIIAACNPYRLKLQHSKPTAGLEGKVKDKNVLAYRVNPLPQSMIAYVWDYGSLSQNDELRYIATIVDSMTNFSELKNLCTNLLFSSQEYIRQCEDKSSVSMRDIARFKKLYHWFYNSLKDKKPPTLEGKSQKTRKDLEKYYRVISSEASPNRKIRSIILALSHCYHSRLSTDTLRTHYREGVCQIFKNHNRHLTPDMFLDCLLQEQKDYLLRMELPEGTALNSSLLENVFVILVCILNKLPVFVVGKPGCSKSLSMQLINSNLRGFDSKDEMFRNLPQVYVVAYQGSESSTADGIEKVFQKAYKYLKDNDSNVIPVVLLDEVGLAEISKHNPLKVLHKLLEPEKQMVAVVGISNWCLDASKMNRAIHLSRPDASIQDLQQTGLSILECFVKEVTDTDKEWVLEVASAFHQYLLHQSYQNFHGLRDYYSLIKFLAKSGYNGLNNELLKVGIERNFGGLDTNEIIELIPRLASETPTPITDLVQLNLADKFARHLMVITNGDSALSLLENKAEVVFGSKFQDDQTEEYNYRVLSRIILCMESGIQLILKDLEQIYGSLYDMLNQNYTIVGKKKNCRIALGAFSNPMCHVHDDFKCVILIDEHNIDYADPPFLNRFEKQRLSYADIFDKDQIELKHTLIKWLKSVTTVEGTDFEIRDAIRSYNNETIDSLVVKHYRSEENVNEIIEACQQDLISLFNFEAILRLPFTNGANNHQVIQKLTQYHQTSPNSSILQYFTSCYDKSEMKLSVIYTFSNIHTDVLACLQHEFPNIETKSLVFKLVHFSCEKQVLQKLDAFFRDTVKQYLFIQCDAFYDSIHLLWLKYQINNLANSFGGTFSIDNKQIFLILHTQRQIFSEEKWIFNFLGKYDQIMIDNLDQSSSTFDLSQSDIIAVFKNNSDVILEKVIPWCFHTIRYPSNNPTLFQRVQDTIKNVSASPTLRKVFLELIVPNIPRSDETDWKKHVLCNRQRVTNSRSIHLAVFEYTCEIVRDILARYIYLIEKYSAFDCILENAGTSLSEEELGLWHKICSESSILNIQALPKPERDVYQYYEFIPQLRFPFSSALNQLLEEQRPQYEKLIIEFEENTFVELTDILRSTTFPKYKFLNHYLYGSEELLKKCLHDILKLQSARLGMSEDFDRFVYIFELLLRMETDSSLTSIYHLKHPMDVIVFMWRQSRRMHALNEMLNLVPCIFESSSVSTVELRDIVERSALYFFPSQKLLNEQYHNSIRDWHRITSQFILLTNRLDLEQVSLPKLVTLKLFNEFISTCIDNSEGKEIELSDTFYDLVKESTDSEDFTNDQIVLRLIGEIPFKLNSESVNKFLGYLILRCDPNAFNDFTAMMIQTIKQQQSAYQLLCYCETDILIYLQDRVDLFELVTNTNSLHEYELLSIIDSNMDSSLSCDISTYIGDLIHSNASFFIQQDQLQDGKILARLISTAENSKYRPFIRVMAVAFLKYFVDKIVDEFKFNCWRNDEKPSMDDYSFIATANDLLKSDCPENSLKHQLRIYFAKKVYTLFPTFKDLTQACMEDKPWGSTFSFLRKLQWPSPQHQGPNYLLVVDHHAEVLNALQQLMYQRNSTQIQTILSHLFVDSKWTYAILSVLVQHIFLKYSFERPFTSEETFTITWLNDYFSKNIKDQKLKAILLSITSNAFTNSPLRLHDQVDSESLEMIILIMHVVILIISYPKCNLADMILKPAQTVNMFIPSMPNSHVETVQYLISEEANEPLTRYTCNACGYMFFVGNCGNINEKSNCPSCKNLIGSSSNKKLDTTPFRGAKDFQIYSEYGYLMYNILENEQCTTFRQNTPLSQPFISFLIHGLILFQLSISNNNSPYYSASNELITIPYIWKILDHQWNYLLPSSTNKSLLLNLLASSLTEDVLESNTNTSNLYTKEGRSVFENSITKHIEVFLKNSNTHLQHALKTIEMVQQSAFSTLELQITGNYMYSESEKKQLMTNLLRLIERKSFANFKERFYQDVDYRTKYPLTDYVLKHKDKLTLIHHLYDLISCHNYFYRIFNHKYTKEQTKTLTIGKLKENMGGDEIFVQHLELFMDTWEKIGPHVTRQGCTKLAPITSIGYDTQISFLFLNTEDEGRYFLGAIEMLIGFHNTIIQTVLQKHDSLKVEGITIYTATRNDIAKFEEDDDILIGYNSFSKGQEIIYDYMLIEQRFQRLLFNGKKFLSLGSINSIRYKDEIFSSCSNLISSVLDLVLQEPLDNSVQKSIEKSLTDSQDVLEIFYFLEAVLWMISKTSADSNSTIEEYCVKWKRVWLHLLFFLSHFNDFTIKKKF
ncbi:hypothetical protein C9374_011678 [Naegleria lovaniensis]|uniref:RZ-type domain-containing protein n=1 Tax=Naegleria lovaniensis TaxID=51637 RepID=A0AA88KDC7_NAELO|nr:uncharacterized protein C9374_011678 [Naegleria lovaniensis]KAG2374013.1 hypothetical protein C9374_011678 [Naegleria lovaniensis]